jgi:transcriptional regulator with XRE-family HTH domain
MAFGKNMDRIARAKGLSLADLARATGIGIGTLAAMRARDSESSKFAPRIAKALGVDVSELLAPPAAGYTPGTAAPAAPIAAEPAPTAYHHALTPLEWQLIELYRGCSPSHRDEMLGLANRWYIEANPGPNHANPFGAGIRTTPSKAKA